ncbi:RRM domain-containing protein [Aphis craccivora]|uniref:RRM domain-containing protein n=1 Tax=Aphis craccivora TaxID=307492 RepID=A0A6G0ZC67_APHCR|nr:RRM domain-containing protein [Aphis craccivora]
MVAVLSQPEVEDREFELWSDVTLPSSDDEEQEKAAVDARRVLGLLEEGGRVLGEIDGRQKVNHGRPTVHGKVMWVRVLPYDYSCSSQYHTALLCFIQNESVDRVMAYHHGSGCTIGGVRVSFSRC